VNRAKLTLLAAASALTLGLAACGEPSDVASQATPSETITDEGTVETAAVDAGVVNFVEKVTLTDMYEIEASKLALERSKVKAVKDYAQEMIDAHTTTSAELQPLAATAKVTQPMVLDAHFTGKLDELRNASVEDFDDKYIDQQTDAHENAANLLRDFSTNGKDAGLQAFAAKTLPAVEMHLTKVKALDDSPADDITKAPS
jgi:putative membrane protein